MQKHLISMHKLVIQTAKDEIAHSLKATTLSDIIGIIIFLRKTVVAATNNKPNPSSVFITTYQIKVIATLLIRICVFCFRFLVNVKFSFNIYLGGVRWNTNSSAN